MLGEKITLKDQSPKSQQHAHSTKSCTIQEKRTQILSGKTKGQRRNSVSTLTGRVRTAAALVLHPAVNGLKYQA